MGISKHLSLSERITIEKMLNERFAFKGIGRELGRDCTTISKEVRGHRTFKKSGAYGRPFNDCIHRYDCLESTLCAEDTLCQKRHCKFCTRVQCATLCHRYSKQPCKRLEQSPYVCNGCLTRQGCTLEKSFYSSQYVFSEYKNTLSEARRGICLDTGEAQRLDRLISPLLRQGQSIHHICLHHGDEIMFSEKTIYNYVDLSLFSARNIDLPRKVRYRPRKSRHLSYKVDPACRKGRTYKNFEAFITENPDRRSVQMDSVIGSQGGKVLLTIHFTDIRFMLAFLRDANTARSVSNIFDWLDILLGAELFQTLFPVILTDNGGEFSNPRAIEFSPSGMHRTHVFYCDPSSPFQKGAVENNHELLRRILPKGSSFDGLSQPQITRIMNHINSYARSALNNHSPYQMAEMLFGKDLLKKLGAEPVPHDSVTLRPSLLTKI